MKSSRFTFLSLILLIIVFVGGIYYVNPLWHDVDSLALGRNEKQSQKNDLAKQLQSLQSLQQDLGTASEVNKQTTLNAIPERFEEDKLITDLTGIAEKNDVVLNAVNFNITNSALDKIKRATVNVNLTGDDDHLISFLKGVETNQRKFVVKSITVQTGKISDATVSRVNFSLNMETYYQDRI